MKQRRIIVCSTEYRYCHTAERTFLHEFILLLPKGQQFDGVVNFPTKVDELLKNKKPHCETPPYKRPPICFDNIVCSTHSVTEYSEMMLTVFGDLITVDLTTTRDCKECLEDYDYYTVLEYEYDGSFTSGSVYIPPKFTSEFKRLLQID